MIHVWSGGLPPCQAPTRSISEALARILHQASTGSGRRSTVKPTPFRRTAPWQGRSRARITTWSIRSHATIMAVLDLNPWQQRAKSGGVEQWPTPRINRPHQGTAQEETSCPSASVSPARCARRHHQVIKGGRISTGCTTSNPLRAKTARCDRDPAANLAPHKDSGNRHDRAPCPTARSPWRRAFWTAARWASSSPMRQRGRGVRRYIAAGCLPPRLRPTGPVGVGHALSTYGPYRPLRRHEPSSSTQHTHAPLITVTEARPPQGHVRNAEAIAGGAGHRHLRSSLHRPVGFEMVMPRENGQSPRSEMKASTSRCPACKSHQASAGHGAAPTARK